MNKIYLDEPIPIPSPPIIPSPTCNMSSQLHKLSYFNQVYFAACM